MVVIPSTKSPLGQTEVRCAGAIYLTLAAGVALVALAGAHAWAGFGMLLLLPLLVVAGLDAVRTASALRQEWLAGQLSANVRRTLASLGPAYRVVSSASLPPACDSYIVIGPNGVFLVLASDDGGRVTRSEHRLLVNARPPWRNLVEDCRVEALRVADRVQRTLARPVPVHAVLCFTRALVAVGREIRGVKIVQVPRLARLIASVDVPAMLSEADVETVRGALVTTTIAAPAAPVFRLTRRRAAAKGERPLTLVGRSFPSQQRRS